MSIDGIKNAVGIDKAHCTTCHHLRAEGDGLEYDNNWLVCDKIERYGHLKTFPFKREMKCWQPNFWHSKFTAMIKKGTDAEVQAARDAFCCAVQSVNED